MRKQQSLVEPQLVEAIEELHRAFGGWNIAWALLRAVRKQRRVRNQVAHLSNQMLRDMGLPERSDSLLGGRSFLWDIRKR